MNFFLNNRNTTPFLWLFLPLIMVILAGYFIIDDSSVYSKEIASFSLMTFAICALALIFRTTRLKKWVLLLSYFFLAFVAFIKLSFYLVYSVGISASALFVIFETNAVEASDYLSNYFSISTVLMALLLLIPLVVLLKAKRHQNTVVSKQSRMRQIAATTILIGIAMASVYLIRKNFRTQNIPYATITTWQDYKIAKQNLKDNLAQPTSPAFAHIISEENPQTYVVVIGESTSSWHMQLYGYPRETNPKLTEIKHQMLVIDSVKTPHVHTITALDKILTLATTETPKPNPNGSIIQLANQAGFETYWLSNQKPVGLYESIPTLLGSAAKQTHFLATDDYNATIYDGALLPKLETILENKEVTKKIIFLHLIGTHLRYEKRYPPSYNVFKNAPPRLAFAHKKAITQTNSYDNAVRYNDAVISDIIKLLSSEKAPAAMIYFSDHGDEVYDTMDFLGHNEYHNTAPMHEVPLLVWLSDKYKTKRQTTSMSEISGSYNLEDFVHTFAQLTAIQFDGHQSSKSILQPLFKTKTDSLQNDE